MFCGFFHFFSHTIVIGAEKKFFFLNRIKCPLKTQCLCNVLKFHLFSYFFLRLHQTFGSLFLLDSRHLIWLREESFCYLNLQCWLCLWAFGLLLGECWAVIELKWGDWGFIEVVLVLANAKIDVLDLCPLYVTNFIENLLKFELLSYSRLWNIWISVIGVVFKWCSSKIGFLDPIYPRWSDIQLKSFLALLNIGLN